MDVVTDVTVGAGAVWAAGSLCTESGNEGVLFRVDPRSDAVVATIPLDCVHDLSTPDCFPSDVAADESGVWVTLEHDPTAGEVVRIDPQTNAVTARIRVQGWPRDVVVGEGAVWVFVLTEFDGETVEGGTLLRIDPGTNTVAATLLRGELLAGGGTEIAPMIAVGEDAVWTWAQEWQPRFANVAVRIDARTNGITRERIPVDHFFPFAVAEGGVWFIGSTGDRATLSRLNATTLEVDRSVVIGITPIDAAFDQEGNRVWVADYWPSVVRVDLP
jgi:DNA-binding beta-propeller fold protein YncE